ncbi:MAG: hypothetical protein ACPLKX_09035 [Dictyoglomaceae bacterium]
MLKVTGKIIINNEVKVSNSAQSFVEVIPKIAQLGKFYTFPITLELKERLVDNLRSQITLRGLGPIDEKGEKKVEFLLQTPMFPENSTE